MILKGFGVLPVGFSGIGIGSTALFQCAIISVRRGSHWEKTILEMSVSLGASNLALCKLAQDVKSGHRHNLMSTTLLTWENTTTAGIQMGNLEESGATPQVQV